MKRIALAAFALVALAASATAQVIPPGTNPVPAGAAYNSTPPTCVNGSGCWLQVDINGQLKVVGSYSLPAGAATSALQGTDPCVSGVKSTLPITLATAAVKVIAVGVSAKKIYVCQLNLNNNAADTVAVFEATTATVCVTAPVAVVGAGTSVATAGTGYNFAATGGISLGNGGAQVLQTATNANDLCIAQSAATQLTGSITYVTQ